MSENKNFGAVDTGRGEPHRPRGRLHTRMHSHPVLAVTSKIVITVVGTLVVMIGIVMMVTPGPAFVMIPLGLAILSTEFEWAHRWLEKAKDAGRRAQAKAEAMDPAVRRRRLLLTGVGVLLVVGVGLGYLATYDWPSLAVDSWDRVQSLARWVPDLPGM